MSCDLRLGRWQNVLADVECDALIVDAPYSERTHSGHDGGARTDSATACKRDAKWAARGGKRAAINYSAWGESEVAAFVEHFAPKTRGWFVSITDHRLAPVWERYLEAAGRYVFSPLAFVDRGSRVRLAGDGPAQWACWIVVARPTSLPYSKWGARDGAYVLPYGIGDDGTNAVIGGKPLWLMRALIRDYSRPNDLVCDPCAGGSTTLLAALMEGRRAVGAECDPKHYEIGRKRLAKGYTPQLFATGTSAEPMKQTSLLDGDE